MLENIAILVLGVIGGGLGVVGWLIYQEVKRSIEGR